MSNKKCRKCGLVNFASALACRRCGTPLTGKLETDQPGSEPTHHSPSPILTLLTSRFGAFLLLLVFIGVGIYNWYSLINNRYYYPKVAFLTPLGILMFTLCTISPGFVNRPRDTKYKTQIWILLVIGLALGGLNFYLIGWVY